VEILLAKETVFTDIAGGTGEGNSVHLVTTSASDFSLSLSKKNTLLMWDVSSRRKCKEADIFSKTN